MTLSLASVLSGRWLLFLYHEFRKYDSFSVDGLNFRGNVGFPMQTDDVLPSLEEQGVRQLYPQGPNVGMLPCGTLSR